MPAWTYAHLLVRVDLLEARIPHRQVEKGHCCRVPLVRAGREREGKAVPKPRQLDGVESVQGTREWGAIVVGGRRAGLAVDDSNDLGVALGLLTLALGLDAAGVRLGRLGGGDGSGSSGGGAGGASCPMISAWTTCTVRPCPR